MKKIILLTTVFTALTCLVGCRSAEREEKLNDPSILNICMPDLGYGTDWMYSVADGFTAKTGHRVNIEVTTTESGYVTSMRAGEAKHDIYVLREQTFSLVTNNQSNYSGYDCILAEYDDLYNTEIEGEGILFKNKMKEVYERYNRIYNPIDGKQHYYAVQWCDSTFGIVKNLKVWKDKGWNTPNTTNELIALCNQIKSGGAIPFIWSMQDSYWWSCANIWMTQYEGVEAMYGEHGFWNGYDEDGNQYVPEMWLRVSLEYTLKTLDTIIKDDNGFQHPYSETVDFTTAQGYFLLEKNKIAMMPNGDWLYKEMSKNYSSAQVEMMKTPILSEIINHPDCEGTIENDAELSALIKAIDAGSTALVGEGYSVSQSAYNKIKAARDMYTCGSNINHIMISPVNSDSLDIVKEFYLYMASEEGLTKFASGSGGFTPAFKISDAVRQASNQVANDFVKGTEAIKAGGTVAPWPMYTSILFTMGGLSVYPTIETGYRFPELIFAQSGSSYMTGEELFVLNYTKAKSLWNTYLKKAGIIS